MKIQASSYLNTGKNEYFLYLAFSFITFPSVHSNPTQQRVSKLQSQMAMVAICV